MTQAYYYEAVNRSDSNTFYDWDLIFDDLQTENDADAIVNATGVACRKYYCADGILYVARDDNQPIALFTIDATADDLRNFWVPKIRRFML